jgi:N-acyl-D-amino-acid deacylase
VGNLVIRGGTVHDGAGSLPLRADVEVTGSTITAIGRDLEGDVVLDAAGCVVAPGFIDIHTHYDAQVFWDPLLTPSCWHGVTTVVAGNCGFSIAPVRAEHRELMVDTLRIVEDMNGDTLRTGVPWDAFETYPEYLDAVAARGVRLNFAGYIGHTAVRLFVMGEEAFDRSANAAELDSMREIVRQALHAGAIGFSTSSTPAHRGAGGRPVPSRSADLAEMLALTEPLRDEDRGVVSLVAGERIGYADIFTLQRHVNRPLTWTPLLVMPGFDHKHWLQVNSDARAAGQDVWGQTACRPIVFQEALSNPFTLQRFPVFAELADVSAEARRAAYRDVSWRRRANAEANEANPPYNWPAVSVGETDSRPDLIGRFVVALAHEQGCTPLDVMLDVALADDLRTRFNVAVANADADAVAPLLQSKGVLVGLADSGAHVGQLCDACFATDLLATWWRKRGTLSLGEAIRKLTGEPASFLGLTDRGLLAPGLAADICVFDPETVAPGHLRRIRDFPANGERLVADAPVGVRHVLVNGTLIRRDGADVNVAARPGRVLGHAS